MAHFRVLSLDGGGSWALIEVMALLKLHGENATGHEVLRQYDLVAATSGGSIVLGGLVEDMSLAELLAFFLSEERRRSIFVGKPHLPDTPKYRTEAKLEGLTEAFPLRGGLLLKDAAAEIVSAQSGRPVHLLVTSFDYDRQRGRFFRSAAAGGPAWGDGDRTEVTVVDAIHASTNAPVLYFDKPAELESEPGKRYWDGGVSGCNNPVLVGVAEAVVLGNAPQSIVALSLGTGTVSLPPLPDGAEPSPLFAPLQQQGILHDLETLSGSILDDPPDAASFLAHVMTGGAPELPLPVDSRVVRMNPMVAPVHDESGVWALPQGMPEAEFAALTSLGMDAVEQEDVVKIERLAALWIADHVRNQPVRMNGATQGAEVGHAQLSQALAAWEMLRALR